MQHESKPVGMLDELPEIFRKAGVRFAYLFGSRARDQQRADSDTDVAVWLADSLDVMERFELSCSLQTQLQTYFATPVDLVVLNDARPTLQNEAVLRGRVLYPRDAPEEVIRFEAKIRFRFEDYAYSQRFFTQARRQRLGLS
jgi:predicted nucleotidyltransferase